MPGKWNALLLRLQQKAKVEGKYKGLSIMTVKVVLIGGELQSWGEPDLQHFEPREDCTDLLNALSSGTERISEET